MSVFDAIAVALEIYSFILLARVLVTWFRPDPNNAIIRFLFDVTEPVLRPIRNVLPQTGMMDFSPLVAFLIIMVLQGVFRSL